MITKRDSFVFYRSFYEAIISLPKDDQCLMFAAIANYGFDQVEPELTGINKAVFSLVKPQIDANIKRYIDGKKGGKHGSKGGRPRKQKEDETTEENPLGDITKNPTGDNLENPLGENEITPNVNANVYVNVNDYVNVNEKDNDCLKGSDKPNPIPKQQKEKIDFDILLKFFNQTFEKKSPFINQKIKSKYNALLAQGYTKKQIGEAMVNASKDQYHIDTGYKYCTLEFFTRSDKVDKFANLSEVKPKQNKTEEQRSLRAELK